MTRMRSDLFVIFVAFAASCVLGVLTNSLRRAPLPMVYENPEARTLRMVASATELVGGGFGVVSFEAARQVWKNDEALILDAREPAFFEEGHIPRAINLPREEILRAKTIRELADKSRPVLVYCSGEDCEDSKIVAKALIAMGYSVAVYAGGWEEWSASGSPVEK